MNTCSAGQRVSLTVLQSSSATLTYHYFPQDSRARGNIWRTTLDRLLGSKCGLSFLVLTGTFDVIIDVVARSSMDLHSRHVPISLPDQRLWREVRPESVILHFD
jgi:hypothetical protein